MAQEHDWQYDLDEYIRQGEPDRSEKSAAWQTAIGLQDVDGLRNTCLKLPRNISRAKSTLPQRKSESTAITSSGMFV